MADTLQLNPERVNKFLEDELNGTAPPEVVEFVNRQRKQSPGMFPPPLFPDNGIGRVNVTGKRQERPAEALPTPPQPQQGFMDSLTASLPTAPEAWEGIKSAGKGALELGKGMLDPEAIAAMAGGMSKSGPLGPVYAGAASGAVALGREAYSAVNEGRSPRVAPVGEAMLSGAVGEGLARGAGLSLRKPVSPRGAAATKFFGRENIMPQQMTDSAPLNFISNVAKHGPGGSSIIKDFEGKQSQITLDKLQGVSHELNPAGTTSINPSTGEFDAGMAGKKFQKNVQGQLKDVRKTSGYPEFSAKYGEAREEKIIKLPDDTEMLKRGPTVDTLQTKRSAALKQSRQAFAAKDFSTQSSHLAAAEKYGKGIERALPDDAARQEYRAIADRYKGEMERLDNPAVQNLRMDTTSNDVVDKILESKVKNYAPMSEGVGQTHEELLGKVQKAASPEAWQQLQADTVHRLGERSVDPKTGNVDVNAMRKMLDAIDPATKQRLFGKETKTVEHILDMVEQASKYNDSQAGRLFIAIRSGQAGIKAAGALGALAAAPVGLAATGHPIEGAMSAAAILISPYAFAKLLTSEMGRKLLTRAATAGKGSAGQQAKRAITRWITQNVTEKGREMVDSKLQEPSDNTIPEPPQ